MTNPIIVEIPVPEPEPEPEPINNTVVISGGDTGELIKLHEQFRNHEEFTNKRFEQLYGDMEQWRNSKQSPEPEILMEPEPEILPEPETETMALQEIEIPKTEPEPEASPKNRKKTKLLAKLFR